MATPRKLFRVSMIIDHAILHDVLSIAEGKNFEIDVQVVKHSGTDQDGAPRSMPSAPEFIAVYIAKHPHFKTRDIVAAAADLGIKKASIHTAIYKMRNSGLIKSVGTAEWKVTAKIAKKLDAQTRAVQKNNADNAKAARASSRMKSHPGGKRTSDKIMGILLANNGQADIHLIKQKLGKDGGGVSPTLTSMIKHQEIVRAEPGVYRVNG